MSRKKLYIPLIILSMIMLNSGCSTIFPPQDEKNISGVAESDTVNLVAEYQSEQKLEDLYTTRDNPFLIPRMAITPRYLYVFNVSVTSRQDMDLELISISARVGADSAESIDGDHLLTYWHNTGIDEDSSRHMNYNKMEYILKKSCLPEKMNLYAGETVSGYILFLTNKKEFLYDTLLFRTKENGLENTISMDIKTK